MELSEKFIRRQLERMKSFASTRPLDVTRRGQDRIGAILTRGRRKEVTIEDIKGLGFDAAMVCPNDERKDGVVLYLHGGGYTCGSIEYAKGFASVLAAECGVRVLAVGYRLAPEFPFPAALEDALGAYRYLLGSGCLAGQIMLAGESAGGGLCCSLLLRLREMHLPLPSGFIAISPWVDLTNSFESYKTNESVDPSITKATLDYYSECYTNDPADPLVSPVFGDLSSFPPSLIFVGGDEVLLDDSRKLHEALTAAGCKSEIVIAEHMWHAYVLYGLKEHRGDYDRINAFLSKHLSAERKLRWMKLDNAAKIYPAAKRRNWNNFFRLSATMSEPVDRAVLKSAMDITMRRFPSIAVRLGKGAFWYYLEELREAPEIQDEKSWPLAHTPFESINKCALRVIVYGCRIAVEFYHALTDGTGGMIFLKTLLAEYVEQKYGIDVPNEKGVLDRLQEPLEEEYEDSFAKCAGEVSVSRNASTAYKIRCAKEVGGIRHLTTLMMNTDDVLAKAREKGVSLTVYMTGAMLLALQNIQNEQVPNRKKQRPLRVVVPVNLRNLFPSKTLRNFAHVVMPEIDPRMGDFEFDEILTSVKHQMGLLATKKSIQAMITPNIKSEQLPILRVMPLFVKNIVMKAIYDTVGERTNCLNLSNLGNVDIPDEMKPYITRFDFVLGVQATKPNNCGVLSYNGTLYMNFIRNTVEPTLEYEFFKVLRGLGLHVLAESNAESLPKYGVTVTGRERTITETTDYQ
ncbi:MAG: alpha/beta hydrolase fold domain-containing protein [Clostridia bacterium]|nr:alpha/beta hydrolase fold domain-containing protein [Clostridia bacterium]